VITQSSTDNQQERVPKDRESLNYYLAGFVDGEGSFSVTIHQVYQHKDNSRILFLFKETLKCGYVSEKGGNPSCYVYCVDRKSDLLSIIIPFFDKYPLVGDKYKNFLLFKEIVLRFSRQEHLTKDGFIEMAKLCYKMNRNGYFRKRSLVEIISALEQSSETTRQTPPTAGMI